MKKKILIKESILVGKSEEQINNEFRDKKLDPNEYLHSAVIRNDIPKVKILLRNGANINYKNPSNGNTALMFACGFINAAEKPIHMIEFLLKNGADVNIKNDYGASPISIIKRRAEYYDMLKILKLLKKYQSINKITNESVLVGKTKEELERAEYYLHEIGAGFYRIFKNNGYDIKNVNLQNYDTLKFEFFKKPEGILSVIYDSFKTGILLPKNTSVKFINLKDAVQIDNFLFLRINIRHEDLKESIGGAGFSVYGGAAGFGNPSMRGFSGRGTGFGGSANLGGGPNLMYTYSVKPLNQTLQQPPSDTNDDYYIHAGSKISGYILNTNKKIEGQITHIEEDEDNNIKYYIVIDKEGVQRKVDPTSCFLIKHDQLDPETLKIKDTDMKESFYPLLNNSLNEGSIKNLMMDLAQFYADNIFELPEDIGMDELIDANFSPDEYRFYLENKESVQQLANEMMD